MQTTTPAVSGVLNVFRDGSWSETLSARLTLDNGQELYWSRCPKCFEDVPGISHRNVRINVRLTNGTDRPRCVSVVQGA